MMKKSVLKMILIAKQLIRGDKLKYIDMATRKRLVVAFATEVIWVMKKKEHIQTSYLSQISQIISAEKKLSCGEIWSFYKKNWTICRVSSKFMTSLFQIYVNKNVRGENLCGEKMTNMRFGPRQGAAGHGKGERCWGKRLVVGLAGQHQEDHLPSESNASEDLSHSCGGWGGFHPQNIGNKTTEWHGHCHH